MSRFELPKAVRDTDSILNEYRPKKWRIANTIDDHSTQYPVEADNSERSDANSLYPAPVSPPINSTTVNLPGHNNKPGHSRLDEIAEALRTLTYGEMLELAESMWKVNSEGSEITESDLPNVLYRWSKSRSIEN
jgi:hypothetical protein